jgi:RecB family exonuclease
VSLEVITASPQATIDALLHEQSDGKRRELVCPTAWLAGEYGRQVALSTGATSIRKGVLTSGTFAALIEKLWLVYGDRRKLISSILRRKFLETLQQESSSADLPLSLYSNGGMVLLENMAQQYRLSATTLNNSPIGHSLSSFFQVYDCYLTNRGFIEEHRAIDYLAKTDLQDDFRLLCLGFNSFTPPQYKLLLTLSHIIPVQIFLRIRKDDAGYDEARLCATVLTDRGADLRELSDTSEERNSHATLNLVRNELYSTVGTTGIIQPDDDSLRFAFAQGDEAQTVLVADLAAEADGTTAILCKNLSLRLPALSKELEARGLDFEVDERMSLGRSGFGAAVLALLRICVDEDRLSAAAAFVSSVYSGIDAHQASALDSFWRAWHAKSGRILKDISLTEGARRVGAIRASNLKATPQQWVNLFTELYGNGVGRGEMSRAQTLLDSAAHKATVDALSELAELHFREGKAQGADIHAEELLAVLRAATVSQTPRSASSSILLSEPHRVQGRSFDTVIICGLDDGNFRFGTEDALHLRLARNLGWDSTPVLETTAGERTYCNEMLRCAHHRLILCTTARELSGEPRPPAVLLDAILALCGLPESNDLMAPSVLDTLHPIVKYPDDVTALPVTSAPFELSSHGRSATYNLGFCETSVFSATDLELWARCPYSWLLSRFASSAELDNELDSRREGSFAHMLLQQFYEALPAELSAARVVPDNLPEAQQLLRSLATAPRDHLRERMDLSFGEALRLDVLTDMLCRFLADEAHFAPAFTPRYFELEFGRGEAPSVELPATDDGYPALRLKGFIDRVDVSDDGMVLAIDYKLSATPRGLEAQARNHYFQGIIYALVAATRLDLTPLGHVYRSLTRPGKEKSVVFDSSLNVDNKYDLPEIGAISPKKAQRLHRQLLHDLRSAALHMAAGEVRVTNAKNNPSCRVCLWRDCPYWKEPSRH